MKFRTIQRRRLRARPRDDAEQLDIVTPDHTIEILEIVGEWRRVRSTDEAGKPHEGFIQASFLATIDHLRPASEVIDEINFVMSLTTAAREFGVNRDYLTALAWVESELKNTVDDDTLATGPFQFTPVVWNELVGQFGVEFGIASGDIIDPGMQATFAAKQTAIATETLRAHHGHSPNAIELYLSHRLGLPAALKVLSADSNQTVDSPIQNSLQDRGDTAALLNEILKNNAELLKKGNVIKTKEEVLHAIEEKMDIGLQKAAAIVARLPADERSGRTNLSDDQRIGELSAKFESRHPGDIGEDSNGGFSYGTYQIATKTGTMAAFLAFAQQHAPAFAQALEAAGGARQPWLEIQYSRIRGGIWHKIRPFLISSMISLNRLTTIYRSEKLQGIGLDIETRTFALKDVVWSVAVQHGARTSLIKKALTGKRPDSMTDREIIDAIYAERSNVEIHFEALHPQKG